MGVVMVDRGYRQAVRDALGLPPAEPVAAPQERRAVCRVCGGPLVRVHGGSWIRAFNTYLWVHARPQDYAEAPHPGAPCPLTCGTS